MVKSNVLIIFIFLEIITSMTVFSGFSYAADDAEQAIMPINDEIFSASLQADVQSINVGEYVTFTLIPNNGIMPYHDAKMFCGDGTQVTMTEISGGAANSIFRAQCRYALEGKYEAYAQVYDFTPAPKEPVLDMEYDKATSQKIKISVTRGISTTAPYADISVSNIDVKTYEPVDVKVEIYNAYKPYRNITIDCGREEIMVYDYDENIFAGECIYASIGEYEIHAIIYDYTHQKITSEFIPVTVSEEGTSGSGSNGGGRGSGGSGACFPKWECTDWSTCSDGKRTRTCADIYTCNWDYKKPAEIESCVIITITENNTSGNTILIQENTVEGEDNYSPNNSIGNGWILGLFILFIMVCGYLYFRWTIPERKTYNEYIAKMSNAVSKARAKGHSESNIHKSLQAQGHHIRHIKKAMKKATKKPKKK